MIDIAHEQILNIKEAAAHLGCSVSMIRAMQARGLEVFRVGNRIRTSKEALDRYFHGPTPVQPRRNPVSYADLIRHIKKRAPP